MTNRVAVATGSMTIITLGILLPAMRSSEPESERRPHYSRLRLSEIAEQAVIIWHVGLIITLVSRTRKFLKLIVTLTISITQSSLTRLRWPMT